jgi:ACS family allantoate permease-like MFS transporter
MANTSGHSKKLTMNAVFFISYCCGNIIGPQLFRANDAPDYARGYIGLLACILVAMLAIAAYGFICARENARRDAVQAADLGTSDSERADIEAFSDMTEKEKPAFRYVY